VSDIVFPFVFGAIGLALSAFFSGAETGLYRASRIRLRVEAAAGDPLARVLVWLVYRPGLFVATALVGNNLANNMVSFAVVLFSQTAFPQPGHLAELLLTALLAPAIFVYGELLPKYLFLRAPNRLLRREGFLFFLFTLLFLPVSVFVWGINFLVNRLLGRPAQPVRFRLARRELRRILEDAHEVGVLQPIQRWLAEAVFTLAEQPIAQFALPIENFPKVRTDKRKKELLELAYGSQWNTILVEDASSDGRYVGYVELWELAVQKEDALGPIHPLHSIPSDEKYLTVLIQMERQKMRLAAIVDRQGKTLGLLSLVHLRDRLFSARASFPPSPVS